MRWFTIIGLVCIITALIIFVSNYHLSAEVDPPHNQGWTTTYNKQVVCNDCHVARPTGTSGAALTRQASNVGLCLTCHYSGGGASNLPFVDTEEANINPNWSTSSGWSHRWDRSMDAWTTPLWLSISYSNNIYGLRTSEELPSSNLGGAYSLGGGTVCSACHRQHYQTIMPWDPSGNYNWGTATGGTNNVVQDSSKTWTTNQWVDFYVRMNTGSSKGTARQIKENTTNSLTIYNTGVSTDPSAKKNAFPSNISSGNTYTIMGRENHFLRMENDANEICVECHYYRREGSSGTDVRNWNDGVKKSHPVNKNLTTDVDESQFVPEPLEPISVWDTTSATGAIFLQTGAPRYAGNGGWDTNSTNNIVLDSSGKVRCMSCHGMHYIDSDSSTPDVPVP